MRFHKSMLSVVLLMATSLGALAQSSTIANQFGVERGQTPVMEIGMNFIYLHANAPPSQCGCFSLNGGSATLAINMPHGLGLVADLSAAHAGQVDATTQNITLFDVLGGLRYSRRSSHRYTPYAQALAGKANEFSNYTFVQGTSSFAATGGGGISIVLGRHFGWNILEADYIYSRLPNANNNRQSDLRLASGVIFRLGPR